MGEALIQLALNAALDKKAVDPVILDTTKLTPMVDYFLICSGQSSTQVKSIATHLQDELESHGAVLLRKEGGREGQWILLDYGWLVAHVMQQESREFYQLERLWHDAVRLDIQTEMAAMNTNDR